MPNNEITVRDFIYVDADRLYSLYSQVFEGVADQIVESVIAGLTTTDSQKGPLLQGSNTEAQVAEASRRTENKSLYDHMYNRLETRLDSVITDASEITPENFKSKLGETFMLKVSGNAEIEDYDRMSMFMERFNELADAIGYSQLTEVRKDMEATWKEQEDGIKNITDRNQKKRAEKRLESNKKAFANRVENYLKHTGLRQDEQLLLNLRLWIEIFNPQGFDITLIPSEDGEDIVFRGILEKKWLRVQPEFLRTLYGGTVNSKWTMVGKVTYIPERDEDDLGINGIEEEPIENINPEVNSEIDPNGISESTESDIEDESQSIIDDDEPSMRDPFRNMFRSARAFDQMFLESKERIEILIAPLAIYHEVKIPQITVESQENSD